MATLITLLTDFGTADSYVGEVKGVLLSQVHGVVLADITHHVAGGDLVGDVREHHAVHLR